MKELLLSLFRAQFPILRHHDHPDLWQTVKDRLSRRVPMARMVSGNRIWGRVQAVEEFF